MNIEVPNNVEAFFDQIKGDFIDFIPNPFYNKASLKCKIHRRVENAGFECLLTNNNGQFILILGVFLISKFIMLLIKIANASIIEFFGEKHGKVSDGQLPPVENPDPPKKPINTPFLYTLGVLLVRRVESLTNWVTLVSILLSLQIDILISVCIYLQAKYYSSDWFIRD